MLFPASRDVAMLLSRAHNSYAPLTPAMWGDNEGALASVSQPKAVS